MKGNNFNMGTREPGKAIDFAMQREAQTKNASFTTASDVAQRFREFLNYQRDVAGEAVRRLENVTQEQVVEYGKALADQVDSGELSASRAQNLVSAVNTAMYTVTQGQWASVSPTRDAGIPQRSNIRETPAADRPTYEQAREGLSERGRAIADLARELGLRSKEASLLNAEKLLQQARETTAITVTDGTKGGRPREIVISQHQVAALERAAAVQGDDRSMIPAEKTWAAFRNGELRATREKLQQQGVAGLHDLRAAYAGDRYETLTGHRPPVEGGQAPRALDHAAREQIAVELGHARIDVTASYLGSR